MEPGIVVLFDIETVATDKAREYVEGKVYDLPRNLLPTTAVPASIANIKDDIKREAKYALWQVEQREKIERAVKLQQLKDLEKAALYWWQSKVISIAWMHVHSESGELIAQGSSCFDEEYKVICDFYNAAIDSAYRVSKVVGKNSKNFDIPYLIGRSLALNIGVPRFLRSKISALGDIDEIFGSLSARNNQITSLANYAFGLGVEGKSGDGSVVETMYKAKRFDDIEAYNRGDVKILRHLYDRWNICYEDRL